MARLKPCPFKDSVISIAEPFNEATPRAEEKQAQIFRFTQTDELRFSFGNESARGCSSLSNV